MELRRLGQAVAAVNERWQSGDAGMRWTADLTVGSTRPGLRMVSHLIVQQRIAFLERWRQHNVEEAGNMPHFLPELYSESGS